MIALGVFLIFVTTGLLLLNPNIRDSVAGLFRLNRQNFGG